MDELMSVRMTAARLALSRIKPNSTEVTLRRRQFLQQASWS